MIALTVLLGGALCGVAGGWPALTPLPPTPPPDPTARGYMGVVINQETMAVEAVEPGRPAALAGLQPQDIIVRVNQFYPQTTQQVIDHVCSFRPGAVIEVEVRRNGESRIFSVKLAARPPEADRGRYPPPLPDDHDR